MTAKLIKGYELTASQKAEVLRAFVNRFTGQHRPQWANKPMPNGNEYHPTHKTDEEWINDHAFYIRKDGRIASRPNHCEPVYIAD